MARKQATDVERREDAGQQKTDGQPTAARAPDQEVERASAVEVNPDPARLDAGPHVDATHDGHAPGPLATRPTVRFGAYAWAIVGVLVLVVAAGYVVSALSLVVIPLILALFPAAVLAPPTGWLRARGLPPAVAALLSMVLALGLIALLVALLAPQVADQLDGLAESLGEGFTQFQTYLRRGPFGLDGINPQQLLNRAREQVMGNAALGRGALDAAVAVTHGVAGFILMLFALFFYLKDGPRISAWVGSLFPLRMRKDAAAVGTMAWHTIGGYIRGQLIIALVDSVLIGIGLVIIGVPLALPLGVLVFFGALFPIVGAVIAGTVAVLVALATLGPGAAVAVLILIIVVQQVEGHLLAPIILGRATELHPLATLAALTGGALLLGVLGAFLAIPIVASATRAVGYLRERVPG